ncbi:MAG: beta-N-acetylhexosaminidase [Bdellovibrionales bacterium]
MAEAKHSLETRVGQLFIVGISGKTLTKKTKRKIRDIKPGSIILFSANIKNAKQLNRLIYDINQYYKKLKLPLPFIGVDQEGGIVTRIKTKPAYPSAKLLGKIGDADLIRDFSFVHSNILRSLGITMNFSPVLDVSNSKGRDFIGSRAFSSDPRQVAVFSRAVIEGANSAPILSTAKHFPGHGGLTTDSHHKLPVLNKSTKQLEEHDLIPYLELMKNNVLPAIMIGHLSLPKIDSSNFPASFSKPLITEILRKKYNYKGLVITDDIEMKASTIVKDPGRRSYMAIEAGVDQVMIAWNPRSQYRSFNYILEKAKSNESFKKLVEDRSKMVSLAKEVYKVNKGSSLLKDYQLKALIFNKDLKALHKKIYKKSQFKERLLLAEKQFRSKASIVIISPYRSTYNSFLKRANKQSVKYFHTSRIKGKNFLARLTKKYPKAFFYIELNKSRYKPILTKTNSLHSKNSVIIQSFSEDQDWPKNLNVLKTYYHISDLSTNFANLINEGRVVASSEKKKRDLD